MNGLDTIHEDHVLSPVPSSLLTYEDDDETPRSGSPTDSMLRDRLDSMDERDEKAKFNRKMSHVVTGLGSHAQGTIKVLQRYYEAASVAMTPSTSTDDDEEHRPKTRPPEGRERSESQIQRKAPIYVSPYESLSNGDWLKTLAEIEAAKTIEKPTQDRYSIVGCVLGALERSGLRHMVLLSLLVIYLLLGALTVNEIENNNRQWEEEEGTRPPKINHSNPLFNSCVHIGFSPPKEPGLLDFGDAVIYCFITITTIGYGDLICSCQGCKIFTIFYLIFGIPLLLMTLSDMGRFMLRQLQRAIDWTLSRKAQRDGKKRSGDSMVEIDLVPAISVVFLYIFVCAGVFCLLEPSWDYFTSLYFVFVSLSTIGFGDVVPSTHADALAACFVLLIGLSLFSLVINVAQRRMEKKYLGALRVMEVAYQTSLAAARRHSPRHRPSKKQRSIISDGIANNLTGFGRIV